MASKQVVDRNRSAKAVVAAGETSAPLVGQKIAAELAPYLEKGEKVPDVELLVRLYARAIAASAAAMVQADEAHHAELADDDVPRAQRDEASARVYDRVVAIRDSVAGLYGLEVVRRIGFTSKTPQEPEMLVRFAREVLAGIARTPLGKPRIQGAAPLDLKPEAAQLAADVKLLEKHLAEVAREVREAQVTKRTRDAAMTTYETRFTHGATVLEALLRAASEDALADRVRPSARRAGQTAGEEEPAAEPPPAAGEG